MYLMYYLNDEGKRVYTLKKVAPDGKPTHSAHPARYGRRFFFFFFFFFSRWGVVAHLSALGLAPVRPLTSPGSRRTTSTRATAISSRSDTASSRCRRRRPRSAPRPHECISFFDFVVAGAAVADSLLDGATPAWRRCGCICRRKGGRHRPEGREGAARDGKFIPHHFDTWCSD